MAREQIVGEGVWTALAPWRRPVGALALVALGTGCGTGDEEALLDALTAASAEVFTAVENEPGWLSFEAEGARVEGTIDNGEGGLIDVRGWRTAAEQETAEGYHIAFSEKLFLEFLRYPSEGLLVSGQIVLTRHAHDFGPPGGVISDANRTTVYRGELSTVGDVDGTFTVDVHAQATGTELWTCGQINDAEIGVGACF